MQESQNSTIVFEQLKNIVEMPGYPFLQHYKEDFYKCDKHHLSRTLADGVRYLWIAREHGSHLVRLGVHPKMHEAMIAVLDNHTDETMDIRLIEVTSMDMPAKIVKIKASRACDEMRRLNYKIEGSIITNRAGEKIASVTIKITGWNQGKAPYGTVYIQPVRASNGEPKAISRADLIALGQIGECGVIEESQSLFTPAKEIWFGDRDFEEMIAPKKEMKIAA